MRTKKALLDSIASIYVDPSASSDVASLTSTGLTVGLKGAAEILHVHPKTVEDLIRNG